LGDEQRELEAPLVDRLHDWVRAHPRRLFQDADARKLGVTSAEPLGVERASAYRLIVADMIPADFLEFAASQLQTASRLERKDDDAGAQVLRAIAREVCEAVERGEVKPDLLDRMQSIDILPMRQAFDDDASSVDWNDAADGTLPVRDAGGYDRDHRRAAIVDARLRAPRTLRRRVPRVRARRREHRPARRRTSGCSPGRPRRRAEDPHEVVTAVAA
jgi:hypothetical protein